MTYDTSWIVPGEWAEHPPRYSPAAADVTARQLLADPELGPKITAMRDADGEWCGGDLYTWAQARGVAEEDVDGLRDFCDGVYNTATACERDFPDRQEPELYRLGVLYARRLWPSLVVDDNQVDE